MVSTSVTLGMSVIPVRGGRLGETAHVMAVATIRDRRTVSAFVIGLTVHIFRAKIQDTVVEMIAVSTRIFVERESVGAAEPQTTC